MNLKELFDVAVDVIGSTDEGKIIRETDSNFDREYSKSRQRNVQRRLEREMKRQEQRAISFRFDIWKKFSCSYGLPLDFGTIVQNYPVDSSADYFITFCDETNLNGVEVAWRCDPSADEVRKIFSNMFPSNSKIDKDWKSFEIILINCIKEDIFNLCKLGFNSKGKDYYAKKDTGIEKIVDLKIDSSDALRMKHKIYLNVFETNYTKCYKKDNGIEDEGCFITTAVCQNFGKPDNCYELMAFRNFRDTWLINQADGKNLIAQYYEIAPKIVKKINCLPNAAKIYKNIWSEYLQPSLNLIEADENSACKKIYVDMVNTLRNKFLN